MNLNTNFHSLCPICRKARSAHERDEKLECGRRRKEEIGSKHKTPAPKRIPKHLIEFLSHID
jgi:hypothetical protein